jgi:hypothetical protein
MIRGIAPLAGCAIGRGDAVAIPLLGAALHGAQAAPGIRNLASPIR